MGYGVETSHLIDVYKSHGMKAFAQTDLDKRVHRNQETRDLGKMSFGILQSFLKRLKKEGTLFWEGEFETVLRQFQAQNDHYETVEYDIPELERPPMITISEYRRLRGLPDENSDIMRTIKMTVPGHF